MPQPKFDNLNDVTSKFVGTTCYYKNEPVYVGAAFHGDVNPKDFLLSVKTLGSPTQIVNVNDPEFRYRDYNIGYTNGHTATWWYRRPSRQYQQGLKAEQLKFFTESGLGQPKQLFCFAKTFVDMLKDVYPSFEDAKKLARDGKTLISAWHRDFAVGWTPIDHQYWLEYRASKIGTFGRFNGPVLYPEANYLKEALQEALSR